MPVPRGDLPTAGHRKASGARGTRVIRLAQGRLADSMGLEMEELTMTGEMQPTALTDPQYGVITLIKLHRTRL